MFSSALPMLILVLDIQSMKRRGESTQLPCKSTVLTFIWKSHFVTVTCWVEEMKLHFAWNYSQWKLSHMKLWLIIKGIKLQSPQTVSDFYFSALLVPISWLGLGSINTHSFLCKAFYLKQINLVKLGYLLLEILR